MARTILVVSDMQIPYHDMKAVRSLLAFASDFQPDMLVNVGDDIDSPQPSQWSKGMAGEYAGDLQQHLDQAEEIHGLFRMVVGDVPYHLSRSNHGDRLRKYIDRYAPALRGLRALELAALAGYRDLGIIYHDRPFEIAPGWVCAHGDEGVSSTIPGRTAGLLAARWGVSVVCGHTHSAGLCPTSQGFGGTVDRTVWGLEVGNLMDMSRAGYLPGGYGNWQKGFGLLYVPDSGPVSPVFVPIDAAGRFTVEGETYGA